MVLRLRDEPFFYLKMAAELTRFVIDPDIDAIRMILPGVPNRSICRPAACAVNNTPLVFTSSTCIFMKTVAIDCSRLGAS